MEDQTVELLAGTDYEPLRDTALALPNQARLFTIDDREELEFANRWTRENVLARMDAIKEFFRERKARARAVWQDFVDLEKNGLEPCELALKIMNRGTLDFENREEAKRKQAEAEARARQKEAERQAAEEARARREEAERKHAEECRAKDEARAAGAAAAEKGGDTEIAEALRSELGQHKPAPVPELPLPVVTPPVHMPEPPRRGGGGGGTGIRKNYKARVTNKTALIKFVAEHPKHENLLDVNESAGKRLAGTYEERLEQVIPGLQGYNDPGVSRRR